MACLALTLPVWTLPVTLMKGSKACKCSGSQIAANAHLNARPKRQIAQHDVLMSCCSHNKNSMIHITSTSPMSIILRHDVNQSMGRQSLPLRPERC